MYALRPPVSLAVLCATAISLLLPAASYGQPQTRATRKQIDDLLRRDPTLRTGFKTPKNATVEAIRPILGGVALRFHTENGVKGEITVVGPVTVMEKGFWGTVVDIAEGLLKTIFGGGGAGGGSGGGGGQGCININIKGNNNSVGNISVGGNACAP